MRTLRKNLFWKIFLISLMLVLMFNQRQAVGQFFIPDNPLVHKVIPEFSLLTTSGKKKSLSEVRDGKSAVVFFWATWCPHCQDELKGLVRQKENIEKQGIKIVLIDLGESADLVKSYLKENNIDFESFLDEDTSLAEKFHVSGVPTLFFVTQGGFVSGVKHSLPDDYARILSLK